MFATSSGCSKANIPSAHRNSYHISPHRCPILSLARNTGVDSRNKFFCSRVFSYRLSQCIMSYNNFAYDQHQQQFQNQPAGYDDAEFNPARGPQNPYANPYPQARASPLNPGYQSQGTSFQSSNAYQPSGTTAVGSGLQGPPAQGPNPQQRFYGTGHPLSNSMFMESSPTLAGSDAHLPDEKMRLEAPVDYATPATHAAAVRPPRPALGPVASLYRFLSGGFIADSGEDDRHVKLPRLGYIDGIKFFAAWLIVNGTYFNATITNTADYGVIQHTSALYAVRSEGLGVTFLLLLMGRALTTPLWDVPPAGSGAAVNSALISWSRLTRAMLVRPFRFILPVIAVAALQWGLAANGDLSKCNSVGIEEPYWALITNFRGFITLVFDLFTWYEIDTIAGKTFAANLFFTPWFFQGSYSAYVCHFMLGNLSSARYWVYFILGFFSWTTYNYFLPVVVGLALADMHSHGHLHTIRTQWPVWLRLSFHAVLIAIACVTQFVPIVRRNLNSGMATINVTNHPELTFSDFLFAACWMLAIETSGIAQMILGNVVFRTLGKLSPGMTLLVPTVTYAIVPQIAYSMHGNGSSSSTILGVCWVVAFFVSFGLAIPFHFVVELPSKLIGEIFAETVENLGSSTNALGTKVERTK